MLLSLLSTLFLELAVRALSTARASWSYSQFLPVAISQLFAIARSCAPSRPVHLGPVSPGRHSCPLQLETVCRDTRPLVKNT